MSAPLIDDSLVEMVAKVIHDTKDMADTVWPDADDDTGYRGGDGWVRLCRDPEMYRTAARAALAVAVPVIAGKCAEVARDIIIVNRKAAMTYADASRGKLRLLDEANAAASIERAIRSLTKDTQS